MNKFSQEVHNRNSLKSIRRELRKKATPEELLLWNKLKVRQLAGRKFRRQHSIDRWVVDFYCPAEKLIVELDGAHHFTHEGKVADRERDTLFAQELNMKIIRFPNSEVRDNIEGVLDTIRLCFTG